MTDLVMRKAQYCIKTKEMIWTTRIELQVFYSFWEQDGTGLRENVAGTELQDDQREAKDHHLLTQEDAGMHVCTFTIYI